MTELEFEFRVYRTREKNGSRECIVVRSVPHAMQVWEESKDAFSRRLELVIAGDWLAQLIDQEKDMPGQECVEVEEDERASVMQLCIQGLLSADPHEKQRALERILVVLGYDLVAIKREHGINGQVESDEG
ncbi:MAG: hypothetical protein JXD18_00210 [Anaerolineae bacterium]|nr:hypothetical protein [Anaerolineae bacterium]